VEWVDIRTLGEVEPRALMGRQWCVTPGCVDETGSRTLFAPTPAELRDRADATWMARQRALVEER
jgi:hypothetical protein